MHQCNSEVKYRQSDSRSHKDKHISGNYNFPEIIFSKNLIFSKYLIDKQALLNIKNFLVIPII